MNSRLTMGSVGVDIASLATDEKPGIGAGAGAVK